MVNQDFRNQKLVYVLGCFIHCHESQPNAVFSLIVEDLHYQSLDVKSNRIKFKLFLRKGIVTTEELSLDWIQFFEPLFIKWMNMNNIWLETSIFKDVFYQQFLFHVHHFGTPLYYIASQLPDLNTYTEESQHKKEIFQTELLHIHLYYLSIYVKGIEYHSKIEKWVKYYEPCLKTWMINDQIDRKLRRLSSNDKDDDNEAIVNNTIKKPDTLLQHLIDRNLSAAELSEKTKQMYWMKSINRPKINI